MARPGLLGLALALAAPGAGAQETPISDTITTFEVEVNGQTLRIARDGRGLTCPPDCVQPMTPVRGIKSAGALEVLAFLQAQVAAGTGVLIDARLPGAFAAGSVPGAVNVPALTLGPDNAYRNDILAALGAVPTGGDSFDYAQALSIMVFDGGPTGSDAVAAIRDLRTAGYPVEKLVYFRGGLQEWQALGLTATLSIEGAALTAGGTP